MGMKLSSEEEGEEQKKERVEREDDHVQKSDPERE